MNDHGRGYAMGVACFLTLWACPGIASAQESVLSEKLPSIAALAAQVQNYDKVPVQEESWGWLRWLMNDQLVPGATMTLGVVQIHAGQQNPVHKHPNCDEVIYVLSGSCEHRVGDRSVVLRAGDVLRIAKDVPHGAKVLGKEPMKSIVVYNTGKRQFVPVEQ